MDLCKLQNAEQSSSWTYMQICVNVIAERKSVDQAVSTERKISVFPFHKSKLCRQPAVVHLAEQNNQSVAMNHNT